MKKIFVFVLAASLICESAFAQNTTVITLPSVVSVGGPAPGTGPVNGTAGIQATGNEAAARNSSSSNIAMMAGIGFAVASVAAFASNNYPMGRLFAGAAVLAGVAGSLFGRRANESQNLADRVTVPTGGPDGGPGNPDGSPNPGGPGGGTADGAGNPIEREYRRAIDGLKPYVRISPDGTVTTSDGKKLNLANMDASGLRGAGYSDKQIKDFMQMSKEALKNAEAKIKSGDATSDMFGDAAGGGGGSRNAAATSSGIGPMGSRSGLDRNPAQVAGMSVSYGGEQIGVGADNIYMMVHRRYILHEGQNAFLPAPAAPPATGP